MKNLVIIGKGNHSKVVLENKEKKDLKLILNIDGKTLINLRRYTKNKKIILSYRYRIKLC